MTFVMDRREYAALKSEAREVYGLSVYKFIPAVWRDWRSRGAVLSLDALKEKPVGESSTYGR